MHKLPTALLLLLSAVTFAQPGHTHIDTLLQQAKQHIFKPGENKTDLDSAANLIQQAERLNAGNSAQANGYILLINSYLLNESGQKDKARETVTQAVALLKDAPNKNLAGEAYMTLSNYYSYNNTEELTQRIDLVKLAVSNYDQAGNIEQKAASLQMLGDLYNIKGNILIALQHLQASLNAYNSIHYQQVQGIYCLMGFIHTRLREYRKGLDMQILALKTAEATGDSSMQLCQIYNYMAETLMALNDKDKALFYYEKALAVAQKHHDGFASYIASVNIGHVWVALNQPYKALALLKDAAARYERPKSNGLDYNIARCYIGSYSLLKQFEKARPFVNQLLEMTKSNDLSSSAKISHYAVVSRFYIAAAEYKEANKYIAKHNELANQLNDLYHLGANQRLRFVLDTARRDYKTAVAHLLEHNRLNDSLSLETKSRQIGELQIQYETDKKEHAIVAKDKDIQLLTRQSQLQESRIENARLFRNFMIVAAALLFLILALLYRSYSIKKKNNRILSEQRTQINEQNLSLQAMVHQQEKLIGEKEWLLKEIHHRVKNNLQIVMSLLNSQSKFIDNNAALAAIHDSQHRVHAMSLIHQKLYGSENVSSINVSAYIREMSAYLADSFHMEHRIRFEYAIEPLEMDVSQAVPLGLILNEAITNAIKYAFPGDSNGVIAISLSQTRPRHYELCIADNGIGISPHSINKKTGSLGMSLMRGLSKNLDGNFFIENNNGTVIKVSFIQMADQHIEPAYERENFNS